DGAAAQRIFSIDTIGAAAPIGVTLTGLTLTNGDGTGNTAANDGLGGAVYVSDDEQVTVENTTITSSVALLRGGAIFAGNGTLIVTGSTIGTTGTGNEAQGAATNDGGGGIYVLDGTATLTDTTVTDNAATGTSGSGGGILLNG